jgi:hypothetical protein
MVTFQAKTVKEFNQRGVEVCNDLTDQAIDSVLVVGGIGK